MLSALRQKGWSATLDVPCAIGDKDLILLLLNFQQNTAYMMGDLSDDATLRRAVRNFGDKDLILLLLNIQQAALGANFVAQLRRQGSPSHFLLTPSASATSGAQGASSPVYLVMAV